MKKMLLLYSAVLTSFHVMAQSIPGEYLLDYFSSNCRTQGEWTRAALADSTALMRTLENISQDNDCRSLGGAIAQLGILNQQLSSLDKVNQTQSKIAELNAQEQELLIQISNNSDQATLSSINETLRNLQLSRAGLIGKEKAQEELGGVDKIQALTSVIQIANSAFGQITGNQKCLQKNPTVMNSAAAILSSIGATTAVLNPALGLGLQAGSNFLGETIEGIRKLHNARTIRKLADNSTAQEAYKCALETMAERWCQMKDAEAFLIFKAQERKFPVEKGLGGAIRINDRELPVLIEWLNKIRSGVTPTTTADAQRQSTAFTRESYIRSLEATGLGVIEESRKIYESYTDLNQRWNFLRSLIVTLLPSVNPGFKNPFYEVLPSGYAPFFLINLADTNDVRNPQGQYYPIDSWNKPAGFNPSLDLVKEKYKEWIKLARTRVNQELTQVIQPDALQTLTSAYDRSGNRWKISPMDALQRMIDFMTNHPPSERDLAFNRLHYSTLEKLKEIYNVTENVVIGQVLEEQSSVAVEKIYELAQLQYGTVVTEARLDTTIRLALLELLENGPVEDQILVAQLLAAERFTETISKISGTDNLSIIRADINRAQPITISNLSSFMEIFGKNISRILKRLKAEEEKSTGTVASSKNYARTELCFLTLATPYPTEHIHPSLCEGLQLKALVKGGPESIKLTKDIFKLDLNQRACEYREFFRKNKIFENWGIK